MKKENIPNILTIIRFILIPFIFMSVIFHHYLIGLVIFTISAITYILDGYIARKYNYITDIGKLIDPLADKLTQIFLLLALSILNILPWWILAIVFVKECVMVISASFLYKRKEVVVYSKWYGKLATVLFYLAIVVTLFIKQLALTGIWEYLDLGIYCCALVCTVFSLIMYVKCLYQGGFIDKSDLNKETKNVVVKDKWSFKK